MTALKSSAPAHERRQFGRRETCIHAWILVEGRPRTACVVRNVSEGGALLELEVPAWMPFRFLLDVEAKRFRSQCEIRHKGAHGLGVTFVKVLEAPVPISSWSPQIQDAWAGKS
jgi:hypothetical protein